MNVWYWISLPVYTFALRAENGLVVETAPIAKWARGKALEDVLRTFRGRGAAVVRLGDKESITDV